ncbi:MAG TPA: ABC transporter permease [Pyrinomonadaceae bacterium]|nr:ABC transporter permease [Pyrinomonadaceae bacterium]
MATLIKDFRYGVRGLLKRPGFAAVVVLTLALGIGANTAIFSIVNAVLLRPLPFPEQERLVVAWEKDTAANTPFVELSVAEIRDWQAQNQSFTGLAAMPTTVYGYGHVLTGRGDPVQLETAPVSGSFFSILGAHAALGRVFDEHDDQVGGPNVVVLSNRLWRERFNSDARIVGQTITLNQRGFTVIGVMPANFEFPRGVDLWKPLLASMDPRLIENRGAVYLQVIGRLKPGITHSQAEAELNTIIERVAAQHPETKADGYRAVLTPLTDYLFGSAKPALWALFAATGFLLLIASANVANLLLARATSRRKELAVRSALGASRGQLIRQLLSESLALAICGGLTGVLVAYWLVELLKAIAPSDIPRLEDVRINGAVLLVSLLCTLVTIVIFGLLPALTASRFNLNETVSEAGARLTNSRAGNRLRGALVVAEVAMTIILLAGATLVLRSFVNLLQVAPGFDPHQVLSMQLRLNGEKYRAVEARREFFRQLVERLEAQPGVIAASGVLIRPLEGTVGWDLDYAIEGQSLDDARRNAIANYESITPHYFRTFGIPLKAGRGFEAQDNADNPRVVIISESMAVRFFGSPAAAVGKRLRINPTDPGEPWHEIVGVAGDVRYRELQSSRFDLYVPHAQSTPGLNHFAVRSAMEPAQALAVVRREVALLDPNQAISRVATMDELTAAQLARPRFNAVLLNWLAGLAMLLAALGIFGVMTYAVAQRTGELGLRIALGAQTRNIMTLVLGQGMKLAALGVFLGLIGAVSVTRWLASLLYGVSATDPLTFFVIAMLPMAAAMLACWIPARRATRVDPMVALKYE